MTKPISSLLTQYNNLSLQTPSSSSSSGWSPETLKNVYPAGLSPRYWSRRRRLGWILIRRRTAVNGPEFWLAISCSDVIALIAVSHVRRRRWWRQRRWSLRTTVVVNALLRCGCGGRDYLQEIVLDVMSMGWWGSKEWFYGKNVEKGLGRVSFKWRRLIRNQEILRTIHNKKKFGNFRITSILNCMMYRNLRFEKYIVIRKNCGYEIEYSGCFCRYLKN